MTSSWVSNAGNTHISRACSFIQRASLLTVACKLYRILLIACPELEISVDADSGGDDDDGSNSTGLLGVVLT